MSPKALARTLTTLIAFVAQRHPIELEAAADAYESARHTYSVDRLWLLVAGAIALLAVVAMARVGVTLKRLLDRQRQEDRYAASESEYIDILQVTESEDEAQELLRRQLERSFDGTDVLVLTRNNSADRLEPKTPLAAFESLHEPMIGARPRSCLAMRLGRGHAEGGGSDALQGCELCGGLPGVKTCEPLLVSGEVIGSVLVNHDRCPTPRDRQRIRETVSQAAPVLGNLRNLAMAQLRAATDGLTGLPNHRAAQDTLKRLVAQASRTNTPLAALIVDVDHFKRINDVHGHDRGDDVLAAVGVGLAGVARESDFVARYGGEEFLLLLPSTDRLGAVHVAEATRNAIASISLPGVELAVTASVGVAVLPDDAGDPVSLFRAADRALYTAKRNGRNRVETATPELPGGAGQPNGDPTTTARMGLSG
ncbi:MAG: GGDEF domain-containing protein [Solirubrobacteraceae bacterium]